jgi:hypothetical protein
VGDLAKQPGIARLAATRLQSAVNTLIAAGQVAPFATPAPRTPKGPAKKGKVALPMAVNRHVAATATEPGARGLVASTFAGRGIQLDLYDRLFTHQLTHSHAANVPEAVWAQLSKRNLTVKRGDEVLKSREAAVAELQRRYEKYHAKVLPLLIQLGIVQEA